MQDKAVLRKEMRAKRNALTEEEHRLLDQSIVKHLIASDLFMQASVVLGYLSCKGEVCVDEVLKEALRLGKEVYVPRCLDEQGKMAFYQLKSLEDTMAGMYGIREPLLTARPYEEKEGAVCLVPGLSFDAEGYRLGYGKGYYDRFLSKSGAISVGICYNQCKVCRLPRDAYDRTVRYLCTETSLEHVGIKNK